MSHRPYVATLIQSAMFASMATAVFLLVVRTADAQVNKTSKYVKVSATAEKPTDNGKQVVTVVLEIDKVCVLFANPAGNEDFESSATILAIKAADKAVLTKVDYPEGMTVEVELMGKYKVYKGKVTIVAVVDRTPGDDSRLEAEVFIQGVHRSATIPCLIPSKVRVIVR